MKEKGLRAFCCRGIFLLFYFLFFAALFSYGAFLSVVSGGDVAEILATCGGDTSCQCGDVITSSRTLNASDNFTRCSSTDIALEITASDVHIDCNGILMSSNGNTTVAISAGESVTGLTNLSIKNCHIENFTRSFGFNGSGNNSLVENNNFSNFDAGGIILRNDVSNITIINNVFNSSYVNSPGVVVQSAINITIRNNTFTTHSVGIFFNGNSSHSVINVSVENNKYIAVDTGVRVNNISLYENVTFRNENISGIVNAYNLLSKSVNVFFINTTSNVNAFAANKIILFNVSGSQFFFTPNLSVRPYLNTRSNASVTFFRNVTFWGPFNITLQENASNFTAFNYTLHTNLTSGGAYFYIDSVLNRTSLFNSAGRLSGEFGYSAGVVHNLSIEIDIIKPIATVNNPSSFSAGTTQMLLNISTNENATCKYDTTKQVYASLASPFNSTTNLTHTTNVYSLVNGQDYTYYIGCMDLLENTMNTTINFSVNSAPKTTSSSSESGGASRRNDKIVKDNITVVNEIDEESSSVSSELGRIMEISGEENDSVLFVLRNSSGVEENHTLTFVEVHSDKGYVSLILESKAQNISLAIGESAAVDITEDDVSDLLLTLGSIFQDEALLYVEIISEDYFEFVVEDSFIEEAPETAVEEESKSLFLGVFQYSRMLFLSITLFLLVFLFVLVLFFMYKIKRSEI